MADDLKEMSFEIARIQEIGKSLREVGQKHKASSFEMMLALTGEICRKYHRSKSEDELAEALSSLIPADVREAVNGGN